MNKFLDATLELIKTQDFRIAQDKIVIVELQAEILRLEKLLKHSERVIVSLRSQIDSQGRVVSMLKDGGTE